VDAQSPGFSSYDIPDITSLAGFFQRLGTSYTSYAFNYSSPHFRFDVFECIFTKMNNKAGKNAGLHGKTQVKWIGKTQVK
jgi:hypothetical protein